MGPLSTIDSVLQECASTSVSHLRQALNSERRALVHFVNQGHKLLYHRQRIWGIEVDLILHDKDNIIQFIEVKTCTQEVLSPYRVTEKQLRRLQRAKTIFENRFNLPTEILLAAVYPNTIDTFLIG